MKWYEIIGLIGSIVSIFAALYTSKYSSVVLKTKNEILSLLKVVKFSNINESTVFVLEQIKKVAHKQTIARGTNLDEIINALNIYYEKIFKLKTEVDVESNSSLNTLLVMYRNKVNELSLTSRNDSAKIIEHFNELYQITLQVDNEFTKLTKKIVEK